jgi:hypothetical protein
MLEVARYLELERGRIVIMPNVYSKIDRIDLKKSELDLLVSVHDQKIKMADEIYVIDEPGENGKPYIGESTRREIQLAEKEGKMIEYFSEDERFREFHENYKKRMTVSPSI